ncbi:high-affinity iron transporter [Andreprevotia lacus DSM 23236]|jgi:high-affinity iron transporter|uniref:High-affinity iron transporter n=1 Tax=Andreprevotia lacus DSM 23236 TaxID=1121001 RepID=A0A1W1XUG5_9NEIS|nr:FTR1 family protein [Andreprevotia lacus]SMC27546.1 high-affinity iron transporter [Andreprevotia lacus DSM 23236]
MDQVLFIVWRESVEALLVVGILYAWLRANPAGQRGLRFLWGGVAAGLALSGLLALVILGVATFLDDDGQQYFQSGMALVASALVVQMVYWMRKHGRTLKRELESGLADNVERSNWWGLLVLVMIAVAREGSETVVFLYGTIAAADSAQIAPFALAGAVGLIAAFATFWLLQLGGKLITWRRFFRITEVLLLLLAGALLVSGLEKLVSVGALPGIVDPLWNSAGLLDDSHGLGKLLADFAGYRAQPALLVLLVWVSYWISTSVLLRRASRSA